MDVRDLFEGVVDLLFPRRCVACHRPGAWLCGACAGDLVELPAQRCRRCGAPGSDYLCPECDGRDLAFARADSAFIYTGPARALVTACKFRALRSLATEMAELASPAFAAVYGAGVRSGDGVPRGRRPPTVDLVTWVPGHRERSLERGFNQAELLARSLSRVVGLPAGPLLRRTRHGARQSGLDRVARAANVEGVFALRRGGERVLTRVKRVVIVDDVYTTGETLDHCARVLGQSGIDPHVFTFARTVRAYHARSSAPRPASPRTAKPVRASLHTSTPKERCR